MAYELDIDAPRRVTRKSPTGRIAEEYVAYDDDKREALGRKLSEHVEGEVRFDGGSRALYATDASNYRQVPLGVILPKSPDDVVAAIRLCREAGAVVTPRGGGTGLAGAACNAAVIIDFSKYMHRLKHLDPDKKLAEVEPGCILDTLRGEAEKHTLTFGPDPATHRQNTIGGMIGNNSCGVHSVMAGRTSDNTHTLDVVTYDGERMTVGPTSDEEFKTIVEAGGRKAEIYKALDAFRNRHAHILRHDYPQIPRRVSGFENLDQLLPENGFNVARALVGTEASCVTVLGATLNLMKSPHHRMLAIIGFDDIYLAADAVPDVRAHGPIAIEGVDRLLIEFIKNKDLYDHPRSLLPEGDGWLVTEFGGDTEEEVRRKAQKLLDDFKAKGCDTELVDDAFSQAKIWELREDALAATAHVPHKPESHPGWEDSAVHPDNLGDYLRELKGLFAGYGYEASVYGHFGDGLIHCRIPFDLRTEDGVKVWRDFMSKAADLVTRHGGTLSGEHGDGQARAELLAEMYPPEMLAAFEEFKRIWDPAAHMNPGKAIDPYPITSNLRVGPEYQPPEPKTWFSFPEDGGSFARATRRCVGVGACRQPDNYDHVMCPSYRGTREEKDVTRGRARLLFEMLHGGAIKDGFKSREVEEALDLCLACKGCKSDCPVNTDMATYKAEFRAHHYEGRLRPISSYAMGLIHIWARIAAKIPGLANFATQTPGISSLVKWAGGIAQERKMPPFAGETFTSWFSKRQGKKTGKKVLLWPDTFNNYFRPETAKAAVELLEGLGYEVVLPEGHVCCGRPLYDWGRLDMAKKLWGRNFEALAAAIEEGTPIVGLEPACVSAFRDELPGLFPGHETAAWIEKNTFFLTEFLDDERVEIGKLDDKTKALVQMHCHHHAVIGMEGERHMLEKAGLDFDVMKTGCCGMAGSFGFEASKYELSRTIAGQKLLPTLDEDKEAIVLANGFSCREQIEQLSGRQTLHVAELLARGLHRNPDQG